MYLSYFNEELNTYFIFVDLKKIKQLFLFLRLSN